jgi:hypothetical protein
MVNFKALPEGGGLFLCGRTPRALFLSFSLEDKAVAISILWYNIFVSAG